LRLLFPHFLQNSHDFNFQMRVLLYKNKNFLMQHMMDECQGRAVEGCKDQDQEAVEDLCQGQVGWCQDQGCCCWEKQVSGVDSQSGDEDDMFEMMAAYYYDKD
jgi:hypothetical protein